VAFRFTLNTLIYVYYLRCWENGVLQPESANHEESSSSHPKPTTQTSDPSVLVELANHYLGELPRFEPNLERASEAASDEVTLESPQQNAPNLQMASNTCTGLIIHPVYQPYHLNATHSYISLGIALRNPSNKNASSHILFAFENTSSFSEQPSLVVQPLSVAPPPEATFVSQPHHVNSTEPEQTHQWFKPRFLNQSLGSSSTSVLESVHDQPSEPSTQMAVTENTATNLPSSSTQALQTSTPIHTTNISSPPTLFLDSIILADVCESIFKEQNKLVKARNNFVHEEDYVKEWKRLRERVDFVMSELQKSSIEAHSNARNTLSEWFKDVAKSMLEVEIKRTQERSKLYISDTLMFLDASGIISSCSF